MLTFQNEIIKKRKGKQRRKTKGAPKVEKHFMNCRTPPLNSSFFVYISLSALTMTFSMLIIYMSVSHSNLLDPYASLICLLINNAKPCTENRQSIHVC